VLEVKGSGYCIKFKGFYLFRVYCKVRRVEGLWVYNVGFKV
jgi:hypothetical protein